MEVAKVTDPDSVEIPPEITGRAHWQSQEYGNVRLGGGGGYLSPLDLDEQILV